MSCAAFTVETGIADAFIEQANGSGTAIGVEAPTGRRLEATNRRRSTAYPGLRGGGGCPCADGCVKYEGEWVQPTDEEAAEAAAQGGGRGRRVRLHHVGEEGTRADSSSRG